MISSLVNSSAKVRLFPIPAIVLCLKSDEWWKLADEWLNFDVKNKGSQLIGWLPLSIMRSCDPLLPVRLCDFRCLIRRRYGDRILYVQRYTHDWEPEAIAVFNKQPFFAVDPFVGCDIAVGEALRVTVKADWLMAIRSTGLNRPYGPRIYLGFIFAH